MQPSAGVEGRDFASAARHASWLFAILAGVGLLEVAQQRDRPVILFAMLSFALVGACLRIVPTRLWRAGGIHAVAVVLLACLGVSTWSADERAITTGPGYVLAYMWMGLHQRIALIVVSVPFAMTTYLVALRLAGIPADLAGSGVVLVPVAALVGVMISKGASRARVARDELRAEERWRAAIMATLAHDVRSPLTSIVGALEIIEDDPRTPEDQQRLVQGAGRQTARILRLAVSLLEVERVDHGRLILDRRDVPLADLLADIATTHPAIALELEVDSALTVWADRDRLEQVVVNLVNNAEHHGAPPVTITATSDRDGVHISVRDHGSGVPPNDVRGLFERFNSADQSPGSVGLGLWIVRLLTQAHGGSVSYRPARPGADFVVDFPREVQLHQPDNLLAGLT